MRTHRQTARRKARTWQMGAIALLAAAGALVALPITGILAPGDGPSPNMVSVALPPQPVFDVGAMDIKRAADELADMYPVISPPPKGEDPPPSSPIDTTDVATGPVETAVASGEWSYIGAIITPTSKRAIVKVDQQQKLVSEGATVDATKVVAITQADLTIETGGARKVIKIADRTLTWPTDPPKKPIAFRTPPVAPGGQPMAAGQPRPNPAMSTPPPTPPTSFDQARAQAMQEAARRGQPGMHPPGREMMERMGTDPDSMRKMLSDPGLEPERRRELLSRMVKPGTSTDETLRQLKESGVEIDDNIMNSAKELEGMTQEEIDKHQKENGG